MFHRPKSDDEKPRGQLRVTQLNDISGRSEDRSAKDSGRKHDAAPKEIDEASLGQQLRKAHKKAIAKHPAKDTGSKRAKNERPMTKSRIRNISDFQLSQRDYTAGSMRDMLHRRAFAWLRTLDGAEKAEAEAEFETNVEERIEQLISAGLIDDARYALLRVRSMRASGKGSRRIQMDLAKKGIEQSIIMDAIAEVDGETVDIEDEYVSAEESERVAAETLARKKRIGPYRRKPTPTEYAEKTKVWKREAGVLARAGYGLDIIREILDREPEEDEF